MFNSQEWTEKMKRGLSWHLAQNGQKIQWSSDIMDEANNWTWSMNFNIFYFMNNLQAVLEQSLTKNQHIYNITSCSLGWRSLL